MGFSIFVEMLNLRLRGRAEQPVSLREAYVAVDPASSTSEEGVATSMPKQKSRKR
jgi:hypothetical protein